jgi:peptide deformylase
MKIITVDSPEHEVLLRKTEEFNRDELPLAQEIADKLFVALQPHFPAAGLAAPQIGVSKSVFIFSYDRDPKHLETVINPTFVPAGEEIVEGREGCLSTLLCQQLWQVAKVPRFEKIQVAYLNRQGERVEKALEGFAAKAFQHEHDHLQGIVNIYRPDAVTKSFDSKNELTTFMQVVKKEDAARYRSPNQR